MGSVYSLNPDSCSDQKTVFKISKQIEIPAQSDYYVKFNSEDVTLEEQEIEEESLEPSE